MLVVIGIGSYKSNYDTIMTAPTLDRILLDVNRFAGKNLFHSLNYIIYGVKAWINKIKNDVNSFYVTKKRVGMQSFHSI